MTAIVEVLKQIFTKLASFFDFFDLSYFVSGGIAALALVALNAEVHVLPLPDAADIGALLVVIVALVTYVLGLQCFAIGRLVRRAIVQALGKTTKPDVHLMLLFKAHGLDSDPNLARYLAAPQAHTLKTLFPRLWVELRQDTALAASMNLITGYWVRAAIYDGLLTAFVLWIGVVATAMGLHLPGLGTPWVGVVAMLVLLLSAVACAREAQRTDIYQIDELVATLRWKRDQPPAAAIPTPATTAATTVTTTAATTVTTPTPPTT